MYRYIIHYIYNIRINTIAFLIYAQWSCIYEIKLSFLLYINCMNLPCTVGSIKPCRNPVNKCTGVWKVLWNGWYVKIPKIMSCFVYVTSTKVVYSYIDIILFLTIKWNRSSYIYLCSIYPITCPLYARPIWSLSPGPVFFIVDCNWQGPWPLLATHSLMSKQAWESSPTSYPVGQEPTQEVTWGKTHISLVVGPQRGGGAGG